MTSRIPITFYTRSGCHLCDDAAEELSRIAQQLPLDIETIDIDTDDEARERYNEVVPAIHIGGVLVSSAPIDWLTIRSAISSVAVGLVEPADDDTEPDVGFSH